MELTFAISTNVETSHKYIYQSALKTNSDYNEWIERLEECGIEEFVDVTTDDSKFCSQSNLKYAEGEVVLKTEEDYIQERIAKAEQSKARLLDACTKYQTGEAKPRIDSNFFTLLMQGKMLKRLDPTFLCPNCEANINWCDALWSDYDQRKIDIDNGDVPNYDFSNNGNPPHTWDECYLELI